MEGTSPCCSEFNYTILQQPLTHIGADILYRKVIGESNKALCGDNSLKVMAQAGAKGAVWNCVP